VVRSRRKHNVVSVDGAFESGDPVEANTGTIFEHTFEGDRNVPLRLRRTR